MQRVLFALGLALVFVATGCSGSGDGLRKEVDALRQEVGRVHAMNATLAARVETLELSREAKQSPPVASKSAPRDEDRPVLDVVRLQPSSEAKPEPTSAPVEIEDLDIARPVFRSTSGGVVVAQNVAQNVASSDLKNVKKVSSTWMKQAPLPQAGESAKGTAR